MSEKHATVIVILTPVLKTGLRIDLSELSHFVKSPRSSTIPEAVERFEKWVVKVIRDLGDEGNLVKQT